MDSVVNVHVISMMRSRCLALMRVLQDLHYDLHRRQLRDEAKWLSTVANEHADKLSRDRDSSDWRLRRPVFLVLHSRRGPLTVDCFATDANAHRPRFSSAVACPGAEAANAWNLPWRGEHN
eukprot:TRINITY_DN4959_c0_g1_i1.p9 TRINITY_DN4959_c0_g1~~TRINITY_DN4959_c0_g1_i1.p9  ORF type:complete len:121 (-),score=14.76 TRINITY_DN4959_c0_g1_i1:384-746(-)